MKDYVVENIKDYVLSYLRNSTFLSDVAEHMDSALYYIRHGQEIQARDHLISAARLLDRGGSDEKKMAVYIRGSI